MATDAATITLDLEPHRRELTGYCYRMLGSGNEADDAVQETMVRAWRSAEHLQARAALRAWLYRIATNVCLTMLQGAQRRAKPMELGELSLADGPLLETLAENVWLQPMADARVLPGGGDPAEVAFARETVRIAFVAALQHLPPRQRAALILREVLHFSAAETAELLDSTVASVNSALQRARATLDALDIDPAESAEVTAEHEQLLAGYVDAFERYDIDALVALLQDDVVFSMPPYPMWLVGPDEVRRFMFGHGIVCQGSRTLATAANGRPAIAVYHPTADGSFEPWSIVELEVSGGRISAIHNFLFPQLFPSFDLPQRLEATS